LDIEFYITLILACLVSYLFGALPFAYRISRRKGIDIFQTGTKLAGASNVLRNVGTKSAGFVLLFDVSKGILSVLVAETMGLEGFYLVLACCFALLGHWNSVFTSFKGGDGLAIGAGIAIGLFGLYGIISGIAACSTSLVAQKLPFSSLFSILISYLVLILILYGTNGLSDLVIGFGIVSLMILLHALKGHKNRNSTTPETNIS